MQVRGVEGNALSGRQQTLPRSRYEFTFPSHLIVSSDNPIIFNGKRMFIEFDLGSCQTLLFLHIWNDSDETMRAICRAGKVKL
mmetsp:Transcript_1600/g.3037  ORF Transcript_1600/g.3037 Transcript_1600/m.3037 type:complete len:83 (+) Transcript_1600:810-1058(+)